MISTLDYPRPFWLSFGFLLLIAATSILATSTDLSPLASLGPLTIALLIGVVYGNTLHPRTAPPWRTGFRFAQTTLLRLGIALYGFRITVHDVLQVGVGGLTVSLFMAGSTLVVGLLVGRMLRMDRDLVLLTTVGSSICGAAAVLATAPLIRTQPYKITVAIVTVVIFGSLSMVIFPLLHEFLPFSSQALGVYIGATVHEVAQVVAIGDAIDPATAATAVVVKLTRVMFLGLALLAITSVALLLRQKSRNRADKSSNTTAPVYFPWFAVGFVVAVLINSTGWIPQDLVSIITSVDVILLAMAMVAVGAETNWINMRGATLRPMLLALTMFLYLAIAGFAIVSWVLL
ncbi:YeiH family protein [Marinobacter sp. TBZ242]|uniref:YeiH family protein n=1 Tax=Marinobacter azerbaijanicus TaxID=3050455 RepID=A0ABT7IHU1_9GAMM|nr:YeiH family protein [Marinobacter sp. TBZ242]MDL0433243.1 YeiH family protein [Marinobacter sp. TBZ242]